MKVLKFIIIAAILGWCLSLERVTGVGAVAQTPTDSIIAPNIFTPNGDGRNDVFEVRSRNGNKVALKIYTRTGVLIFSIEAERCRWDGYSLSGQEMANGVYFFTAETVVIYDSSPKVSKSGFVHLFR